MYNIVLHKLDQINITPLRYYKDKLLLSCALIALTQVTQLLFKEASEDALGDV